MNVNGSEMFGEKNKRMRHRRGGIDVDLFAATPVNWFNYLVCRTGPAESNLRIASTARALGMKGSPYGGGFSQSGPCAPHGESSTMAVPEARPTLLRVTSERGVFECVGLPYAEPWERR